MAIVPVERKALSVLLGPNVTRPEGPTVAMAEFALGPKLVAVCFSASYCKHCSHFVPKLQAVAPLLRERLGVEPLLFCNDRTQEAYTEYLKKTGLPAVAWEETQILKPVLREAWGIATIPHVVLLDSETGAVVQKNVRFAVEAVHEHGESALASFIQENGDDAGAKPQAAVKPAGKMTLRFRLMGKASVWDMGHKVSAGSEDQFMCEQTVRVRAGLLHLTSWCVLLQHFFKAFGQDVSLVPIIFPLVGFEFLTSALFGITPFAPYGVVANLIAHTLRLHVDWKPARPKRFSWFVGLGMASTCITANLLNVVWLFRAAAITCCVATWLEAACGWCLGCFIWNHILTPAFGLKACEECRM